MADNPLFLSAVGQLNLDCGPFEYVANSLGDGATKDFELCFVNEMPPVSSDIIRAHSYLDSKIYRVKGWGKGNDYEIYKAVPGGLKFDSYVDLKGGKSEELRQILGLEPGSSKLAVDKLTHETIASINDILPVCKIKYFGLTSSELLRMTYNGENLEKTGFFTNGELPVKVMEVELYRRMTSGRR